jgi:hypothetical protein
LRAYPYRNRIIYIRVRETTVVVVRVVHAARDQGRIDFN